MPTRNAAMDLFSSALTAEGVTGALADVARSIYAQESGSGRNTQTSNAGARGGMQIIPSTFAGVADKGWDINDPLHNARAGIRYLKQLDKQAGGDPVLTAAGYYGGPGGLEKARKGVAVSDPRNPNAPNTLQYAQQVANRLPKGKVLDAPPALQTPQPVQETLAQAAMPQMAQGLINTPSLVPAADDPWLAFQQNMQAKQTAPTQMQPADIDYGQQLAAIGQGMPQLDPRMYAPVNSAVTFGNNFQSMRNWRPV